MRTELRLEIKQVLTPQLLLNLKLLVLPNLELETLVQNELEQNPALEIIAEGTEESEKTAELPEIAENKDEFDIVDLMNDDSYRLPLPEGPNTDITEIQTSSKSSYKDSLLPIAKSLLPETDADTIEYIIGNITNDGFLTIPEDEIIKSVDVSPEHLKEIIDTIHHIEPGGIACSNLQDALICQLKVIGYDNDSYEIKIIRDHYDLLLKRNYAKIANLLNISEAEIAASILNIQSLETRPARRYLIKPAEYITPDFSIEWRDDTLIGSINDETFPFLRISPRYREMLLHPKDFASEEIDFARSKLQNAINLIKAIEARKQLLHRILEYIITNQREFLVNGKEFIKPIPIKTAAEFLGVHISTISRACQAKYIETPVGIFSLKFFFSTGIGEHSRHSIKEKIHNLINQEDKTKPFTDDEIVALLAQQNIHLSRRTVAKYREELNISGSNERVIK